MDELKELHDRKNKDYATDDNPYSNFEFAALLVKLFNNPVDQTFAGIIGNKLARLGELLGKDKSSHNESIRDTMRDLTCYMGIWAAHVEDNTKMERDQQDTWNDAGLDRLIEDVNDV